ncbi:MAG: ABC transporter permease [Fibrobacteria bacterium]|nr:ABC transporter permease [Fibrobacteria bacterium]
MRNVFLIFTYTAKDRLRQKSFWVIAAIAVVFVLFMRGCYDAEFSVNGKELNSLTIAWHASKIIFHIVGGAILLITILLGMRLFPRDREDGGAVMIVGRPVARWQYALGRVLGVWMIASIFMFCLHLAIFLIVWNKTGGVLPGYLTASVICFLNILFVVNFVALLSFSFPGFASGLFAALVLVIGFVSASFFQVTQSKALQSALSGSLPTDVSWWRAIYPKTATLQYYASSFIGNESFTQMGSIHPILNVIAYTIITGLLLFWRVQRQEY